MGPPTRKCLSVRRKSAKIAAKRRWERRRNEKSPECNTPDIDEELPDLEVEKIPPTVDKPDVISGQRLVDLNYVLSQLKSIDHGATECTVKNLTITKETVHGFKSIIYYKCDMCGVKGSFSTQDESIDVNKCVVAGAVAAGIGYKQLAQVCAATNMPVMSQSTYINYETEIAEKSKELALESMIEAGKEEYRLAVEAGNVINGLPAIDVIVDGAWSKRSYRTNYNALSCVSCIMGARTKKILYAGIKNKYCLVCDMNKKREKQIEHTCSKNWNGTSTAMESEIIYEGFLQSVPMHNLRYARMIGDGDSSVYNKLCTRKPYGPDFFIDKIRCRNHALRNYCNKIRLISNTSGGNVNIRNFLRNNILKLRIAVTSAIQYRKTEAVPDYEKIENLRKDILNSPKHIFNEHSDCSDYFCKFVGQSNSVLYNEFANSALYGEFYKCLKTLADLSSSLLCDKDTNIAEVYNSIVNKMVGGKRINYSLKGSYEGRCYAAAIDYNKKGTFIKEIIESIGPAPIGKHTKLYIERQERKRMTRKKTYKKRQVLHADEDYGRPATAESERTMTKEEEEAAKSKYLETLNSANLEKIERETRPQRHCREWQIERLKRLTASNFGKICKMRASTDTINTVKHILYGTLTTNSMRYGTLKEEEAKKAFSQLYGVNVEPCGLIIDRNNKFLGASPDGLIGDDAILEIKCSLAARNMTIQEGIQQKKITYCALNEEGQIKLKLNHPYMFQIQGQLHITRRRKCYFVVYTENDIFCEVIEKDDKFWNEKMENILVNFYLKCLLPELVDPRIGNKKTPRRVLAGDLR